MRALGWAGPTLPLMMACGGAVHLQPLAPPSSPLGPSTILVPRSVDDDALLGRIVLDVPENGRSLEEVSRPNDCGDKLAEKKEQPLVGMYTDTEELAPGGKARAVLRMFDLEEGAETATHFYYKLDVEKQVTRAVTPEYLACCKDKGTCGYGFVSALIYGQGVYASATENGVEDKVDLPVARGLLRARILQKRYVTGYVAAFVTIADGVQAKPVSVLGDQAAVRVDLTEHDLTGPAKDRFDAQKIQVVANNRSPARFAYVFRDGQGEISENEFVRRYEALAGSTELQPAKKNRNAVWLDYGIAATVVGASLVGIGAYFAVARLQVTQIFATPPGPGGAPNCNYSSLTFVSGTGYELACTTTNQGLGIGLGVAGGAILASGIVSLVTYGIRGYDGSKTDHVLGKADAERYAAKYNRELLHQATRESVPTQRQPSESGWLSPAPVRVLPVISPGFTGLVGQF